MFFAVSPPRRVRCPPPVSDKKSFHKGSFDAFITILPTRTKPSLDELPKRADDIIFKGNKMDLVEECFYHFSACNNKTTLDYGRHKDTKEAEGKIAFAVTSRLNFKLTGN